MPAMYFSSAMSVISLKNSMAITRQTIRPQAVDRAIE